MTLLPELELQILNTIKQIDAVYSLLPGVAIVHRLPTGRIEYMSPNGLAQLALTLQEVRELTTEDYHERYFNPDDAKDYVPKVLGWLESNSEDSLSFFQQVRVGVNHAWVWHMSTLKIILRDDAGTPVLAISMAFKVDPMQNVTDKLSRLLEENNFLRVHYHLFLKLTLRERDILRLQAMGYSSQEIAGQLFIAATTVETHRRNIKRKLNVSTAFELAQYARAFDLV